MKQESILLEVVNSSKVLVSVITAVQRRQIPITDFFATSKQGEKGNITVTVNADKSAVHSLVGALAQIKDVITVRLPEKALPSRELSSIDSE